MDNENTTPKKQDNNEPEQESKRRELVKELAKQRKEDKNADEELDQFEREFSKLWENDPEFRKSLNKSISALVEAAAYIKETAVTIRKLYPELEESTIRRLTIPQIKELLKQKQLEQGQGQEVEQAEQLLEITVKHTENVDLALDKLTLTTFTEEIASKEQFSLFTLPEYPGHPVLCLIDFDGIDTLNFKTSRKLDLYDEFIAMHVEALRASNGIFSMRQLLKNAGLANTKTNKNNALKSMEKMRVTIIKVNNYLEVKKSNYPPFEYDDAMLPYKRLKTVINGKETEAIQAQKSVFYSFAEARNQITTIDKNIFDVPINKTRRNIGMMMYFAKRISHLKAGYGQPKALFTSLMAEFKISNNHKKEFLENAKKILFHFKKTGFINNYDVNPDSFYIHVTPKMENKANKKRAIKEKTEQRSN